MKQNETKNKTKWNKMKQNEREVNERNCRKNKGEQKKTNGIIWSEKTRLDIKNEWKAKNKPDFKKCDVSRRYIRN